MPSDLGLALACFLILLVGYCLGRAHADINRDRED